MEWRDTGIVLSRRLHGETSVIVDVLTPSQGRHLGVVPGGRARKMAAVLQPGSQVDVHWRARLEAHLGKFTIEPVRSRSAAALSDRLALAGLNAVTALLSRLMPEREAMPELYQRSEQLLDLLGQGNVWPLAYLQWEMLLLDSLGYGLDLSRCAATGARDNLIYVSPRTGRAVSAEGAGAWAQRLLPLPPVMLGASAFEDKEIVSGLRVTEYFLAGHVCANLGIERLPSARGRLIDLIGLR